MNVLYLIVGILFIILFLIGLMRTIRYWRVISRRNRIGEVLQLLGVLLCAVELLIGMPDKIWGVSVIVLGWLINNPEELTRPVKLFGNRCGENDGGEPKGSIR